jgi:pyruvate,water dikinase
MVIPSPEGGVRQAPVPRMLARQPVLMDDQAREIGRIATKLEDRFERPLDIEGGIAEGRIYLFQARPITTCFAPV